jgi:hypothetical protein
MVDGSTCNCFCPMWKLAFCAMTTKVSQITSWVLVCSLPWVQHKRWIHRVGGMCAHILGEACNWRMWFSLSYVQSTMENIEEDDQKARKIGWSISHKFTPRLEHDKIWAQWVSNILLENMLEKVWWCRCFEMGSWSWTICCQMSCSKGGKYTCVRSNRKSHAALKCCCQITLRF